MAVIVITGVLAVNFSVWRMPGTDVESVSSPPFHRRLLETTYATTTTFAKTESIKSPSLLGQTKLSAHHLISQVYIEHLAW